MTDTRTLVPAEIKSHRFPELDSLRGLAALTVMLHHFLLVYAIQSWYRPFMATPLRLFFAGEQAVIVFFILSGFVLSVPQSSSRKSSYRGFLLKRFCRIYLPFLAALAIALWFDAHYYQSPSSDNPWLNETWTMQPHPERVIRTMLTEIGRAMEFNTAFWSVLYEVRLSIVFPLLYSVVTRIPVRFVLIATALTNILIPLYPVRSPHDLLPTIQIATYFVCGILLFRHLDSIRTWWTQRAKLQRGIILFCILTLSMYGWKTVHLDPVSVQAATVSITPAIRVPGVMPKVYAILETEETTLLSWLSVLGASGSIIAALFSLRFKRFLNHPFLIRLGALSYSTYLIHGTVLFWLLRVAYGRVPFAYVFPVYLVVTYLASELFHFLIDRPSLELGRWMGKRIH